MNTAAQSGLNLNKDLKVTEGKHVPRKGNSKYKRS